MFGAVVFHHYQIVTIVQSVSMMLGEEAWVAAHGDQADGTFSEIFRK